MRIVIYSPLAANSAIGRVAVAVGEELARRAHRVSFVRSERDRTENSETHATNLPTRWWHDVSPGAIIREADVVLVNIGDNYLFHAGALSILDGVNCLGIFHDFYLYSLFREWAFDHAQGANAAALHEQEVSLYGGSLEDAQRLTAGETPLDEIAARFPMTEWLASRCGAALAHAQFYAPRLDKACAGPVAVASLCYAPRNVPPLEPRQNNELVVATVGHINPNKCCDLVIAALADASRDKALRYRLIGPIAESERERLTRLASDAGVALDILGAVSDDVLEAELARADILCCLRKPVLEGASASAIEAMMTGRPVIVADAGFYADLPDECVVKVGADAAVEPLRAAFEKLIGDEPLRRRIGDAARRWSLAEFTVQRYVVRLEILMQRFVSEKPYLKLCRQVGDELARMEIAGDDPAVGRLADVLDALLSKQASA